MKLEGNSSHEDDSNGILLQSRKNSAVRLQIVPAKPKTITHLPKRPPVDLAFSDLTYKVREGRKSSKYLSHYDLSFIYCMVRGSFKQLNFTSKIKLLNFVRIRKILINK
jgi:hypothetical protein